MSLRWFGLSSYTFSPRITVNPPAGRSSRLPVLLKSKGDVCWCLKDRIRGTYPRMIPAISTVYYIPCITQNMECPSSIAVAPRCRAVVVLHVMGICMLDA